MKIPSGTEVFDKLLEGGYDGDVITTIYGPAATGKTTACLLAAIEVAKNGGKVIFVDTENGFSVERLKQLTKDYKKILDNVFLIKVASFEEQDEKIFSIFNLIKKTRVGLVIVDTIGAHYRNVLQSNVKRINDMMADQLRILTEIARDFNTAVIFTNQVYGIPGTNRINIVGGDMLRSYSGCLIELKKFKASNRGAILKKHKSLGEKEIVFKI